MAHWSSCAVYNEPALPAGPCDCGNDAPDIELQKLLNHAANLLGNYPCVANALRERAAECAPVEEGPLDISGIKIQF